MKLKLTVFFLTSGLLLAVNALAQEDLAPTPVDTTRVLTTGEVPKEVPAAEKAEPEEATTEKATETPKGPVTINNKICPVSGKEIGSMGEGVTREYNGKIYHFCCPMCLNDFDLDPEKYVGIIEEMMATEAAQGSGSDEKMEEPVTE